MTGTWIRRIQLFLLVFLLVAGPSACGDTTTSHYCTFNSDCPAEGPGFCVNGICRSEQCQEAEDCANGQQCIEGVCSDG